MEYLTDQERRKELEELYGENANAVIAFTMLEDILQQMCTLHKHSSTADPKVVASHIWPAYEFVSEFLAKADAEFADEYKANELFLETLNLARNKEESLLKSI